MGDIGNFCLLLALVCAVWSVLTSWLGRQNTLSDLVRSGERAAQAAGILITIGTLVLIKSFLDDDFSLLYVAPNSTRSQPALSKGAALWGGQARWLCLWACIRSGSASASSRAATGRTSSSAGAATGPGIPWRTPASCRGLPCPPSSTP